MIFTLSLLTFFVFINGGKGKQDKMILPEVHELRVESAPITLGAIIYLIYTAGPQKCVLRG